MSPKLRAALDHLYEEFRTSKPCHIALCDHCEKSFADLLDPPLREISSAALDGYVGSLFNTCGDVGDFRYFLPRMIELACAPDGLWPEQVLLKLPQADWRGWPRSEQHAIESALTAALREHCAAESPEALFIDGLICGAALAEIDLDPFLRIVAESPAAASALYEFNLGPSGEITDPRNAFGTEVYRAALGSFLQSPEMRAHADTYWRALGAK